MRLVDSSVPGEVERDQAIRLLTERAILTRMVCRELLESNMRDVNRRTRAALFLLLRWVDENMAEFVRVEPRADDGLDRMIVPDGYQELVVEIVAGAQVCSAFFMLLTADTSSQADGDRAHLQDRLASYWVQHGTPIPVASW